MNLAKKDDPPSPLVFINPEVTWKADEKSTYEEGCLSIPEYYEEVERPAAVRVKYLDLEGKPHEIEATGLLATCLQHEIDHTNGVLFIDYISKLKRDMVMKRFKKAAKKTEGATPLATIKSLRIILDDRGAWAPSIIRCLNAPDLHGHARFRGADAARARRRRARHRGGLYARRQAWRTARP